LKQLSCIHVPNLLWDNSARITWADIDAGDGYVLQRRFANESGVFPDDFATICDGADFPVDDTHYTYNWADINSANMTLGMALDYNYSWNKINSIIAPIPHVGFDDEIPDSISQAEYRLIIYSSDGVYETISSGILPALEDIYEDNDSRNVTAGSNAYYRVTAKGISAIDKMLYITYNHDELALEYFYCSSILEFVSKDDGILAFRLTKKINADQEWSGLVVALKFNALESCRSPVHLQMKKVKYPA